MVSSATPQAIDRFDVWRRSAHPALVIIVVLFGSGFASRFAFPNVDPFSPFVFLDSILSPALAVAAVLVMGRRSTLPVFAFARTRSNTLLIFGAVFLLVGVLLIYDRASNLTFGAEDYFLRTSLFPIWLGEQISFATLWPLMEEIVFRGVLQTELQKRIGPYLAVPITAALFALSHYVDPQSGIQVKIVFVVGIVVGIVRVRTDSLGPPVIVHGLYNAIDSMLQFVA